MDCAGRTPPDGPPRVTAFSLPIITPPPIVIISSSGGAERHLYQAGPLTLPFTEMTLVPVLPLLPMLNHLPPRANGWNHGQGFQIVYHRDGPTNPAAPGRGTRTRLLGSLPGW